MPLFALVFLGLGIDASDEGPWNSPFASIGHILFHNLNKTVPIQALAIPLFALALLCLLIIHICRRLSRSSIDGVGTGVTNPMGWALGASFLAVVAQCGNGLISGDLQMAKIQVQIFRYSAHDGVLLSVSMRDIATTACQAV